MLFDHSFSTYAKFCEKRSHTVRTRTYVYQEVRNVSFSEHFAYVLNEWPLSDQQFQGWSETHAELFFRK